MNPDLDSAFRFSELATVLIAKHAPRRAKGFRKHSRDYNSCFPRRYRQMKSIILALRSCKIKETYPPKGDGYMPVPVRYLFFLRRKKFWKAAIASGERIRSPKK